MRPRLRLIAGLAIALVATGCGPSLPEPEGDPAKIVERLLTPGKKYPADPEQWLTHFAAPDGDEARARLLDTIESLRRIGRPRASLSEPLSGPDHVAVDVTLALDGGGSAELSAHMRRDGEHWRITWITGPGVSWPMAPQGRDAGISSPPPPG